MSSLSLRQSSLLAAKGFGAKILGAKGLDLVRLVQGRIEMRRTRKSLGHLDARLLADIGLSAEVAAREARRPF